MTAIADLVESMRGANGDAVLYVLGGILLFLLRKIVIAVVVAVVTMVAIGAVVAGLLIGYQGAGASTPRDMAPIVPMGTFAPR